MAKRRHLPSSNCSAWKVVRIPSRTRASATDLASSGRFSALLGQKSIEPLLAGHAALANQAQEFRSRRGPNWFHHVLQIPKFGNGGCGRETPGIHIPLEAGTIAGRKGDPLGDGRPGTAGHPSSTDSKSRKTEAKVQEPGTIFSPGRERVDSYRGARSFQPLA